jgi:hypothetical protein
MKNIRKILLIAILSLTGLCLLLVAVSAASNLGLPQRSSVVASLSEADKIHLAETQHLRQAVGDDVWPGWGQVDIPAILFNESYAFLVGFPDPPEGWVKVPANQLRGGLWEVVPGDTFYGEPYYRQALPDPDITPENFTVMVGERWVSSLQSFEWAKISLVQPIRQDLPPFLRPIFPYRLFVGQLLGGSDKYISLIAHETFHAYQGMMAPQKLAAAEDDNRQYESRYPWGESSLQSNWQTELDLLADALLTSDQTQTLELARQFLLVRNARRESAPLSPELINYEQQREWLEGLARYAELEIWRQANTDAFTPLPGTAMLTNFDRYTGFETRWSQEIQQMRRMADDEGDGRFYYSGLAQAVLLDKLYPDWKLGAFEEGVWLDDLLLAAVKKSISSNLIALPNIFHLMGQQSELRDTLVSEGLPDDAECPLLAVASSL